MIPRLCLASAPSHLAKDLSEVLTALFWDFMGSDKAKYHVTETPQQMFISLATVLVCKNWKEIIRKLHFFKPVGRSSWFAINSESFFFFWLQLKWASACVHSAWPQISTALGLKAFLTPLFWVISFWRLSFLMEMYSSLFGVRQFYLLH